MRPCLLCWKGAGAQSGEMTDRERRAERTGREKGSREERERARNITKPKCKGQKTDRTHKRSENCISPSKTLCRLTPASRGRPLSPPVIMSSRPFTVVVEGNIGSGKSTFLAHFKRAMQDLAQGKAHAGMENSLPRQDGRQARENLVEILAEPVDKWRDLKGHNLLQVRRRLERAVKKDFGNFLFYAQLMYSEPGRWSLAFQSYVQLTMVKLHLQRTSAPIKLMERSLHSGRHCFIENLYRSGKLPGSEYSVLDEWYRFLTSDLGSQRKALDRGSFDLGVDLVVYLRTSPEMAFQRVKRRARTEEDLIPVEYLRELHGLHEEWLMGEQDRVPAKVLVINADEDIYESPEVYTAHCQDIFRMSGVEGSIGKELKPVEEGTMTKGKVSNVQEQQPKAILGEVNR